VEVTFPPPPAEADRRAAGLAEALA
jgi:hypothetical protein